MGEAVALLDRLVPVVRKGVATAPPWPFDDPMSLYEASNRVSQALGYVPNGLDRATRRGEAAELHRWLLSREHWSERRREDIELVGVADCLPVLGIDGSA